MNVFKGIIKPQLIPLTKEPELLATNLDHTYNSELAKKLKRTGKYALYAGMEFEGYVRWSKKRNLWICEVWKLGAPSTSIFSNTLTELMQKVSESYGFD